MAHSSWWRLALALIAFMLWAHPSLVGLPCAALLLLAPANTARGGKTQPIAGVIAALSLALLFLTAASGTRLGAMTATYVVLVTAAFIGLVLLEPAPLLRTAIRSIAIGGIATAVLIQVFWGMDGWGALNWETLRQTSLAVRTMVEASPPQAVATTFALYEPIVRFLSMTWPGMLALQTLAGLALAWQLHLRLTALPLGEPLARFRDFCMGDAWVWGIVAWLGVLILPVSRALHVAGTNVGLVAATLFVLRGAAIVATFAEAFGLSALVLVIAAAAAAALAVPLIFILPGLCTLGITDTWYQYRRRLAEARERRQHTT